MKIDDSKIYKACWKCNGTGKVKIRQEYLKTPDVRKMLRIMKKFDMNQLDLAKVLNISQGTINGWFHAKTNMTGKIKPIYFVLLEVKGYY